MSTRRRDAAIEVARAMAMPKVQLRPVHGSVRDGREREVFCAQCGKWHVVMVGPELALQVHMMLIH